MKMLSVSTHIFPPPLTYTVFTLSRENRVEQSARPTFDKGELIVQICILLQMNLEVKKDCKIRIVPPFFSSFPIPHFEDTPKVGGEPAALGRAAGGPPNENFHSHLHLSI